jgi:hypothetical protein
MYEITHRIHNTSKKFFLKIKEDFTFFCKIQKFEPRSRIQDPDPDPPPVVQDPDPDLKALLTGR